MLKHQTRVIVALVMGILVTGGCGRTDSPQQSAAEKATQDELTKDRAELDQFIRDQEEKMKGTDQLAYELTKKALAAAKAEFARPKLDSTEETAEDLAKYNESQSKSKKEIERMEREVAEYEKAHPIPTSKTAP